MGRNTACDGTDVRRSSLPCVSRGASIRDASLGLQNPARLGRTGPMRHQIAFGYPPSVTRIYLPPRLAHGARIIVG